MDFNYNTTNNALLGYTSSSMYDMQPVASSIQKPSTYQKSAAGKAEKPKRKQVKNACVNCQKACKKCDDGRPCQRCIKLGLTATCTNSARKERKKGVKRGPYKKRQRQTQEIQVYSSDEWQMKHSRKNSDQLSLPYSFDESSSLSTGSHSHWGSSSNTAVATCNNNNSSSSNKEDNTSFISQPILDPSYTQPVPMTTPPLVQSSSPLSSTQSDDIYYTTTTAPSTSPFATTHLQDGWWEDQLLHHHHQQQSHTMHPSAPITMSLQNDMASMMYPTESVPMNHHHFCEAIPTAQVPSTGYMYSSLMVQPIYQQQQQQQPASTMMYQKLVEPTYWVDQPAQFPMVPQYHGSW
ncbi:hypothetical protein EC973_002985 [Apophysomyces ossiformis]|uniref:Zn(2)-C6 fungal-type domain-containing protein n=1 Tax=Apophysomyces ossiformis TaxID=679940 RepID=A0A8H7BQR4_9FUNG|nr:hypothetical protein EC973_002985 [Apophysomyces ossiformis]